MLRYGTVIYTNQPVASGDGGPTTIPSLKDDGEGLPYYNFIDFGGDINNWPDVRNKKLEIGITASAASAIRIIPILALPV